MQLNLPILSLFAPKINAPKQVVVIEDTSTLIFSKIAIQDINSKKVSINLSVSDGVLNCTTNKLIVSQDAKNLKLIGNLVDINKFLKTISYQPIKNSNKKETLSISAKDETQTTNLSVDIIITPVNDAPIIDSPNIVYIDNKTLSLQQPIFFDIDSSNIIVTLISNNGSFQVINSTLKINIKNNVLEIIGNISTINDLFLGRAGFIKLLPNNNDDIQLSISISDRTLLTKNVITVSQKPSLTDNATNAVISRLVNKNADISKNIYSIMDHSSNVYVRNIQNWASDLDLTSISPWNSAGGNRFAGTLISPRHIIYATHYQIPVGSTVRFVTKNNEVVEKKLINKLSQAYAATYFPDLTIGLLDSDVPSSISFAKILPENWLRYFVSDVKINVPCLVLDQEEKALVSNLWSINDFVTFDKFTTYTDFFEYIIVGDSGNPAFMIIDNQLVILTVWTFGNAGSGTFITSQKNQINKFMKDLGSDYQLTEIDLNNFRILS